MRIKNEGKRTFFFNGGKIAPGEVVDIRNVAIANALLKCYPDELICLDDLKVRVVESEEKPVEEPAPVGEAAEEEVKAPAPKKTSKRKKA